MLRVPVNVYKTDEKKPAGTEETPPSSCWPWGTRAWDGSDGGGEGTAAALGQGTWREDTGGGGRVTGEN